MDISRLFTAHYYFDLSPEASNLSIFFAIYFLILFIIRAHLRFAAGKHEARKTVRKLQRKHLKNLAVIGILGLLSIGARHLDIMFFGMRTISYVLVIWSFYEIWKIRDVFKKKAYTVVTTKKNKEKEDKYMPKPKKKRKKERRK